MRLNIKPNIIKNKHQVCNVEVYEILNQRKDIEMDQDIKKFYDCIIQINNFVLTYIQWYS